MCRALSEALLWLLDALPHQATTPTAPRYYKYECPGPGSLAGKTVCPPCCKALALKGHRSSADAPPLVTSRDNKGQSSLKGRPRTGCLMLSGSQEECSVDARLRQPRADWESHRQGFLAPTFHVEGLELDQVPNGTWQICQLIPFYVQYLRKRDK